MDTRDNKYNIGQQNPNKSNQGQGQGQGQQQPQNKPGSEDKHKNDRC